MPIIYTEDLIQGQYHKENDQIYNGLDCAVTVEVHEEIRSLFNEPPEIYGFELGLQAPLLDVMLRGFRVNENERRKALAFLDKRLRWLRHCLDSMTYPIWGQPLNPRSHPQMKEFFYGRMGIPEIWISQKGVKKLSFNRDVLEKMELYFYAMPIVSTILCIRDILKQKEILETEIDPDGRMRTSYNIGGTETWRLSSSSNAFGSGGNVQNWPAELRQIFEADPGYKLCVIDYEQGESREIGFIIGTIFGDWSYLDLCEAGDLHTGNTKLIWPELGWTGDPKNDRKIAEQIYYRDYSYRHLSKVGVHGSTYYGTAWTMARHLKVPVQIMSDFQDRFFGAVPCIGRWHRWTAEEIQTTMRLTTAFGSTRQFFGRPGDDTTLREALAFQGQAPLAHRTNLALWRLWKHMGSSIQNLAQTHDSVTFQYREADEAEVVRAAWKLMDVELRHGDRSYICPSEPKIGWNWNNRHDDSREIGPKNKRNDNGLVKWRGPGADKRTRLSLMEVHQ